MISKEKALENIELLRNGMPISLKELYVLPTRAKTVHDNFSQRMVMKKWGFLLVTGENRAGKSAYIKHLHRLATDQDFCIAHFEINENLIKSMGVAQYLNKQLFERLRFPTGDTLLHKLITDIPFQQKVHSLMEDKRRDFEFHSPALTSALSWSTQQVDESKNKLASSWLRGESLYVSDMREIEIFDRSTKSLLNVPTDKLIYFFKELVSNLGYSGILITLDEIERVGTLSAAKGKETLFWLRNLIDALVSDESQPAKRGILDGIFLCFAISTFYLGFTQVIDIDPIAFQARVDREGRPKVLITDVPRLAMLLKHSATMVDVELEHDDLVQLAERITGCYNRAFGSSLNCEPAKLAEESYNRTTTSIAGPNVQQIVHLLDEEYKKAL
jgi:hypothetical protein